MSILELYKLFDIKLSDSQDSSLMINAVREMNGMKKSDLRNVI